MTREEAIAYFKDMNECTYGDVEPIHMAIKALEQEPILDRIRADIKAMSGDIETIADVLAIIDKYRAESEE